jgi:hypothetical protein
MWPMSLWDADLAGLAGQQPYDRFHGIGRLVAVECGPHHVVLQGQSDIHPSNGDHADLYCGRIDLMVNAEFSSFSPDARGVQVFPQQWTFATWPPPTSESAKQAKKQGTVEIRSHPGTRAGARSGRHIFSHHIPHASRGDRINEIAPSNPRRCFYCSGIKRHQITAPR